jgi:hypothetical protein
MISLIRPSRETVARFLEQQPQPPIEIGTIAAILARFGGV